MNEAYRITFNAPIDSVEEVISSISKVFRPLFGDYQDVFWSSSPGVERYRPLSPDNPGYVQNEEGESVQVRFVVPRDRQLVERIINQGIRSAHPWEEPVIVVDECFTSGKVKET